MAEFPLAGYGSRRKKVLIEYARELSAWIKNNGTDGRVDLDFFIRTSMATGRTMGALTDMPEPLPADLDCIVQARAELSIGDPITYAEMNAWLHDHPGMTDRNKFKRLLRAYDLELLTLGRKHD